MAENKEITDLKKILGLESGKTYRSFEDVYQYLRYGKIMFLTDADMDGSHIKGLCINVFQSEWPSLFQLDGFLSFMNTPILRATRGKQSRVFYNNGEYNAWLVNNHESSDVSGWKLKYFKGLGTSTAPEFKEYFANQKIVNFQYLGDSSDDVIDKIFNKKRAEDRKEWLGQYDRNLYVNTSLPAISYEEFVDKELIHFSTYSCERTIPSVVDGLKTSLRKILYSALKRKLTSEIKVAQFSGYVAEHSAYHHGEQSLNAAIVSMAQDFVGSNNIHLLEPCGQFGTKMHGGKDSASERYIFTMLNPLTRAIFPELDDSVLTYLDDDGTLVEPKYYVPILPFVLVNGISGIGTGYSTDILPYHPLDLLKYLRYKIEEDEPQSQSLALASSMTIDPPNWDFLPYFEGFQGTVTSISSSKFLIKGKYEIISNDCVRITELPIGTWIMPYKDYLDTLTEPSLPDKSGKREPAQIREFVSNCTETLVDFVVTFSKGQIELLESTMVDPVTGINGLEKLLKLTTMMSNTNMYLFDENERLRKYHSTKDILDAFYPVRRQLYEIRKTYLVGELEKKLLKVSNRVKYIEETLGGSIDLRHKKTEEVTHLLEWKGYQLWEGDYKYLTRMPMDSVTEENIVAQKKEMQSLEYELEELMATTLGKMWKKELNDFEDAYLKYVALRNQKMASTVVVSSSSSSKKVSKKPRL